MGYYAIQTSESLTHHGTKGQKWGVRNADWYPIAAFKAHLRGDKNRNDDSGTADKAKKKSEPHGLAAIKKKQAQKKAVKQKAVNLEKARKAKAAAEASRKEKEEIIRTGDIEKAVKRIDDFSNEELRTIRERNKAKIDIIQARTDKVMSNLGTITDASQKVMNLASNSINAYNSIAKVANTFGDKEWKIIGQSNMKYITEDKTTNKRTTVYNTKDERKTVIESLSKKSK